MLVRLNDPKLYNCAWLFVIQLEQEGGEEGEGGIAQNDMAEAKLQQSTPSGSDDSDDDSTVCSHLLYLFM